MTLATKITIARIILIVPTVVFYIVGMIEEAVYLPFLIVSCVLFAILCSTDFVDGHIARKTNTVSALGKFLDPLADKIVIVVMLFLIVYFRDFTLFAYDGLVIALLGGLILTRELTVSVFRAVAASRGLVLAADIYGKIKTVLLDIGTAFLILGGVHEVIKWIGEIVFFAGAVLTVWSGVRYLVKNKQVLSDINAPAAKEEKAEENAQDGESVKAE
ncbi:MAG TPA: CDP-diacylglycerol--glycerol-3-phosphate 3-phosphatidyltransferase [Candidatus Limadaptatus stercorigallinarum]|uniref:CDP-diacylglycerol--glycerol-3-phosphate 3-phosphatidyltransferase n=1 Tax=Candidatus Limadaptatus stercorigallinarum TaxID=2840845 RepID=A0A9D1HQS7_9FIRM|nr:CDP-diacylglycerol--glycerol-3-phosphate 3-phosphatidyltransferase [Candidatus Limadaptatus stercorigallinarum]